MDKHTLVISLLLLEVINCSNVCFKAEFRGNQLHLKCVVDYLRNEVKIIGPDAYSTGYYCKAPIRLINKMKGTCSDKHMTQDLENNITLVSIKITETSAVSGRWMCEHGSMTGRDSVEIDIRNWYTHTDRKEQSHYNKVYLKYTVDEDLHHVRLSCSVNFLEKKIIIYDPNKNVYGKCLSPNRKRAVPQVRCDNNFSQNLKTNTTTVLIPIRTRQVNGFWTCQHGADGERDTVYVHIPKETTCAGQNVCCILLFLLLIGLLSTIPLYKTGIFKRLSSQFRGQGYQRVPGQDLTVDHCEKCSNAICVYCHTCRTFWCQVCCIQHTDTEKNHKICEIDHLNVTNYTATCDDCNDNAIRVCRECKNRYCNLHQCDHQTRRYISLSYRTGNIANIAKNLVKPILQLEIDKKCKWPIKNHYENIIRVCGISFVSNGCVVAADYNNKQLILYKNYELKDEKKLEHEPRGMTSVSENCFAVTIADLKEIRIFKVLDDKNTNIFNVVKSFSTSQFGKPYSLAYSNGHYLVEMGKSEQGNLGIFNTNGQIIKKISVAKNVAYFTGETIRLSLHWANDKKSILLSAIGMKKIVCLDLEGKEKWETPISSPRDIIYVPGGQYQNLIMASKQFNILYHIRYEDEIRDITCINLPHDLHCPRYLAYQIPSQLLAVSFDEGIYMFEYKME